MKKPQVQSTAKKPLYQKFAESSAYSRQEDAKEWVREMKEQYKQANISIRYEIHQTVNSQWKAVAFQYVGNV